jgi:hypothetical protein
MEGSRGARAAGKLTLVACMAVTSCAVGCTLYQMPPQDPAAEAAVAQSRRVCGPTSGELVERVAAMPLLIPLDMLGLVEPGNPLTTNSNASSADCQQAKTDAMKALIASNQSACAQFAGAALAKYPAGEWQQVSCQCKKFVADRRFVSESSALSVSPAERMMLIDANFSPPGQPANQVEVRCQNRSEVVLVQPPRARRFPNYGCASQLDLTRCQ